MSKKKKFKQRSWYINFLAVVIRFFKKKITIINLGEDLNHEHALYISNHAGASGPISFITDFPVKVIPWGTHEPTEGIKNRWNYLYHIFYRQKKGYGKIKSFILACLLAFVIRFVYHGVKLIPTYPDIRQTKCIRMSMRHIEANHPILIFPEDSDNGYDDEVKRYNSGFVSLIYYYQKKYGRDIPIYSVYYSKKEHKIVIDEPKYIADRLNERVDFARIAEEFKNRNNELYRTYILPHKKSERGIR